MCCIKAAKEKQKIRAEEIQIDVVERKKQIEVEEKEVARKDKELVATVKRPAEAESYRVETIAQGKRCSCYLFKCILFCFVIFLWFEFIGTFELQVSLLIHQTTL